MLSFVILCCAPHNRNDQAAHGISLAALFVAVVMVVVEAIRDVCAAT